MNHTIVKTRRKIKEQTIQQALDKFVARFSRKRTPLGPVDRLLHWEQGTRAFGIQTEFYLCTSPGNPVMWVWVEDQTLVIRRTYLIHNTYLDHLIIFLEQELALLLANTFNGKVYSEGYPRHAWTIKSRTYAQYSWRVAVAGHWGESLGAICVSTLIKLIGLGWYALTWRRTPSYIWNV